MSDSKKKVLIAGGSGFIGLHLANKLISLGYNVAILTRNPKKDIKIEQFHWNINNKYIQEEALKNADYIINLAGTNIAEGRWTQKQKQHIKKSRVQSTMLLFNEIKKRKHKPNAFISASAIGYYGTFNSDEIFSETHSNGNDFLAKVCTNWENAARKFGTLEVRTVIIRTGIVFDKIEGAFPKIIQSLKYGVVAGLGSGKQYIPWIHLEDMINIYIAAIENKNMNGAYNAVSPDHLTQNELNEKIRKITKKIKIPNLPGFLFKLIYGEMSAIFLTGSRISAKKIMDSGFKFKYSKIEDALIQLLKHNR